MIFTRLLRKSIDTFKSHVTDTHCTLYRLETSMYPQHSAELMCLSLSLLAYQ